MFKHACIALSVLLIACSQINKMQKRPSQTAIPVLHVSTDTGKLALAIAELHIDVQVTGNIATTIFDIRFYNPMDRVMEGEFEFPLADGQTISRYALEINDKLREGVVVEKMKARIAFENTARQGIDPGLAEKTRGNNFRTRIYPIPAKGTKRIVIGIEQTLDYTEDGYLYQLPLYAKEQIGNFSIDATVLNANSTPDLERNELKEFQFSGSQNDFTGSFKKERFAINHLFAFSLRANKGSAPVVLAENYKGKSYFYLNAMIDPPTETEQKPNSIGILWDVSGSAEKRNRVREMEFLEKYLLKLENVRVLLIPFNISAEPAEEFVVENGRSQKIMERLKEKVIDGGTQLGALNLQNYNVDKFLLFSDGISSFGKKEIALSGKPIACINSTSSADFAYLKFLAEESKGKFIDLLKQEPEKAAEEMMQQIVNLISLTAINQDAEDLVARPDFINHNISIAGTLKSESAIVEMKLGYDRDHIVWSRQFTINKKAVDDSVNVKRIWAAMKVEQLDLQYEKNKDAITALGKEFSIVTQNTSLLVLDRVEDYVTYEIEPPGELQKEYYALLREKVNQKEDEKNLAFNEALDAMKKLRQWWNRKFNPDKKPIIVGNEITHRNMNLNANFTIAAGVGAFSTATDSVSAMHYSISADQRQESPPEVQQTGVAFLRIDGDGVSEKFDEETKDGRVAEIKVKEWSANAGYVQELEKSPSGERFKKYLELKKQYGNQPSFFVDVAYFFYQQHEKEKALLVLSNVAELKLEDAELLRIMAYRLLEMNETTLAIESFKEILKMREEEPHSYRDLALAHNEAGNYSEAASLLYKLVTGKWDSRFGDVKSIALSELNATISAHQDSVDISGIDPRLIYAMPVDVRIVVGWTSDNSDIDLWITDPNKEKCFYGHPETVIGGRISKDVTQGYGPEEFLLKKAKKGNYVVEANLFGDRRQTIGGPITITADLFTDFGKPTQKRKTINFRLTENKEVVEIGALNFNYSN